MQTLKFNGYTFMVVSHHSGSLEVHFSGVKWSSSCAMIGGFQSTLSVSIFHGSLVVNVIMIMIGGSKKRDCRFGFEVQSSRIIEMCNYI